MSTIKPSESSSSLVMGDAKLKVANEIKKVQEYYESDQDQKCFNLLLLGAMGTGKNVVAGTTCRFPAHIDSFDPGGSKHLRPEIKQGKVLVDTRFEKEDPFQPTVYALWKKVIRERISMGYFERFGTYILDSATTWVMSMQHNVMKLNGMSGQDPRWAHDYSPVKTELQNIIRELLKLPCDFILTGHLKSEKDDVSGKVVNQFMTVGQGAIIIPTLFDEKWVTISGRKEGDYSILTRNNGSYLASTRIGRGKFEPQEKPDIKYLLKKAGLNVEDKPLLITK